MDADSHALSLTLSFRRGQLRQLVVIAGKQKIPLRVGAEKRQSQVDEVPWGAGTIGTLYTILRYKAEGSDAAKIRIEGNKKGSPEASAFHIFRKAEWLGGPGGVGATATFGKEIRKAVGQSNRSGASNVGLAFLSRSLPAKNISVCNDDQLVEGESLTRLLEFVRRQWEASQKEYPESKLESLREALFQSTSKKNVPEPFTASKPRPKLTRTSRSFFGAEDRGIGYWSGPELRGLFSSFWQYPTDKYPSWAINEVASINGQITHDPDYCSTLHTLEVAATVEEAAVSPIVRRCFDWCIAEAEKWSGQPVRRSISDSRVEDGFGVIDIGRTAALGSILIMADREELVHTYWKALFNEEPGIFSIEWIDKARANGADKVQQLFVLGFINSFIQRYRVTSDLGKLGTLLYRSSVNHVFTGSHRSHISLFNSHQLNDTWQIVWMINRLFSQGNSAEFPLEPRKLLSWITGHEGVAGQLANAVSEYEWLETLSPQVAFRIECRIAASIRQLLPILAAPDGPFFDPDETLALVAKFSTYLAEWTQRSRELWFAGAVNRLDVNTNLFLMRSLTDEKTMVRAVSQGFALSRMF